MSHDRAHGQTQLTTLPTRTTRMPSDASRYERLLATTQHELRAVLERGIAPGLHVVATPIGHLADVTLRALACLVTADKLYCEDTRHTAKLLARYGIDRRTQPYHEHNAERERPRILGLLQEGQSIALVSDAGTPLISDPGYKLVRAAVEAGHAVTALPGPSAILAALVPAGLPTDAFHFAGFLPPRTGLRRRRITELSGIPATLVLFEAPSRTAATLNDLAAALGDRPAAVARELTKLHETIHRGGLLALADWAAREPPRGEIVILVAPPLERSAATTDADIERELAAALEGASLRDAVGEIVERLGVARSRVYDLAVGLRRRRDETDLTGRKTTETDSD